MANKKTSLDWVSPDNFKDQTPLITGEERSFTYGGLQAEMDLINIAYIEVMSEGDVKG